MNLKMARFAGSFSKRHLTTKLAVIIIPTMLSTANGLKKLDSWLYENARTKKTRLEKKFVSSMKKAVMCQFMTLSLRESSNFMKKIGTIPEIQPTNMKIIFFGSVKYSAKCMR